MDEKRDTRAGYVAVIGRPNVGKSTLINTLLEQKVAAVSPKPQTTRRRQLGILTSGDAQVIFVDTPGLHNPQHKLGDYMNETAIDTILEADMVLWLLDASTPFTDEDRLIAGKLNAIRKLPPIWMVLTKCDLVDPGILDERERQALELFPARDILRISTFTNQGLKDLLSLIISNLPASEFYYDSETVTDAYEREIAADLIRESVLTFVRDEVPHCSAVQVESYEERPDNQTYIEAVIFVERDSQRGILVGKGGEMIKRIGTRSRQEIEAMSGRKVYLNLKVQVNKNWRNNPQALALLGFGTTGE